MRNAIVIMIILIEGVEMCGSKRKKLKRAFDLVKSEVMITMLIGRLVKKEQRSEGQFLFAFCS